MLRVCSRALLSAALAAGAAGCVREDPDYAALEARVERLEADRAPAVLGTNRYLVVRRRMSWPDAHVHATSLGGHLVTITDRAENRFVVDLTREKGVYEDFWIGFTDEGSEGKFRWVTGEPVRHTSWRDGEPNNVRGNQDFAAAGGDYQWDDRASGGMGEHRYPFVVEFEGDSRAQP